MELSYEQLSFIIEDRYPVFARTWSDSRASFGQQWEDQFNETTKKIFGEQALPPEAIIEGYAEFSTDAVRSQVYFERKGSYKNSDYAQVAREYYHNPDFMFRSYLPGMVISHFVWPHHFRMLSWFKRLLATSMGNIGSFCEVGTGCGLYSAEVLEQIPGAHGVGYDISESSLSFTKDVIDAFGHGARYDTRIRDIIEEGADATYDLALSQEVLEHLEDPAAYLQALHSMVRPCGYAYIAAAVNAAHVDHIYLYRSPDEVAEQINAAGFRILDRRAELAYGGKPLEVTPCHAGFLCKRS